MARAPTRSTCLAQRVVCGLLVTEPMASLLHQLGPVALVASTCPARANMYMGTCQHGCLQ